MKISGMKKGLITLLLFIAFVTVIRGFTPQPRADPMCGYMPMEAKIYCYGGQQLAAGGGLTSSFDHYFFSINLAQDWQVIDMLNAWEPITQDVGPNVNFAMEIVPNENIIFMHGGAIASVVQTRYKAAYFNVTDIAAGWKKVIPEQNGSRVTTQSAILGPDNSTIYIWGGMRNRYTGDLEPGDEEFPRAIYTLNVKNWEWGTGSSSPAGCTFAKPVLVGSSIYYIGGDTAAPNITRENVINSVLIYNTDSASWRTEGIGGSVTPSTRTRHTVNLKPSTGEIILLGGKNPEKTNQSRADYFYILNTQGGNLEWSTRELGGDFNALGITGHSAVLAGDYLFVLFGAVNIDNQTSIFNMTNEVRIMDVNKWSWVSSISALTPEAQFPTTGSSSFNTGTIAGAAVGGAAVFALFAGLIAFFLIRRRKKKMLEEEKQKPSSIRMLPDENELSQVDSNTIYATTRGQSDSSTTQGQLSAFYNSQKPDASVLVTRIHKGEYRPVSLAMKPVKPDGG